MTRREIREQIFKILFRTEFHPREEFDEQLSFALEELADVDAADFDYIKNKVIAICDVCPEIDQLINEKAEKWKTSRMAKAELAILRLAVYEMKYEEEMPEAIAINEAVELAKSYGAEHGAAFVNGVLAKIV